MMFITQPVMIKVTQMLQASMTGVARIIQTRAVPMDINRAITNFRRAKLMLIAMVTL